MTIGPGAILSHYRIVEKIGEGGMGVVYRAQDTKLRRQVALKILPPDLVANEERRLRFLREARTAAAINHPNIATIYEIDEAGGVVFIAMELVEGRTLREHIRGRPMPIKETLRIATEMAEGLAEAHKARVIHRDLKPDNVIVGTNGRAKILDFGLAKLHEDRDQTQRSRLSRLETASDEMTRAGRVFGTPAYMSPEQARGQKLDARSDLFAFGSTLYEMATGNVPFRGGTGTDTLSAIIRDEPLPLTHISADIPQELERIVSKCLQKDPAERYQDSRDLVVDLRHLRRTTDSGAQRIQTPSGPVSAPHAARGRRHRLAVLGGVAAVLIAIGFVTMWSFRSVVHFKSGDRIIVADFENRTDQPHFSPTVRDAFEEMLSTDSGPRLLTVIRGAPFEALKRDKGHSPASRVNRDGAAHICREGACAGFVTGSIDHDDVGYRIDVSLYHVDGDEPVAAGSQIAPTEQDILMTIHELALTLRLQAGESASTVRRTAPPTTRSLAAYQTFAAAGRRWENGRWDEMIALLEPALTLDPGFVEAYDFLWLAYSNIGNNREARRYAAEGYKRASALPEKARLTSEINFLAAALDGERVIDRLKRYRGLYPEEAWPAQFLWSIYYGNYQDVAASEPYARSAYELGGPQYGFESLVRVLSEQGKADEIERLMEDVRGDQDSEELIAIATCELSRARGEPYSKLFETVNRLDAEGKLREDYAANWRLFSLLLAGRFAEAEQAAEPAWRLARRTRSSTFQNIIGLQQSWLAMRRRGSAPAVKEEQLTLVRNDLRRLGVFATFAVEAGLAGPLESVVQDHERFEENSESRYVQEELQFGRGCLAFIKGDAVKARELLEPLAHNSLIQRRHHVLGRTYEALGMWDRAASSYEKLLENPFFFAYTIRGVYALDRFRLARVYERLGNTARARHWYERFTEVWKDADPDIPELIEARKWLEELQEPDAT